MKKLFFLLSFNIIIFSYSPEPVDTSYLNKKLFYYISKAGNSTNQLNQMKAYLDSAYYYAIYLENYDPGILSNYYLLVGMYYNYKGEIDKTLTYFMLCIKSAYKNLNKYSFNSYHAIMEIGNIYYAMGLYNEFLINYYKFLLNLKIPHSYSNLYAVAYNNVGLIYEKNGLIDSALVYFYKGYNFRRKHIKGDDTLLFFAHSLVYISRNLIKKGNYKLAKKDLLIAKSYFEKIIFDEVQLANDLLLEAKYRLINTYLLLSKLYYFQNDIENHEYYLKLALNNEKLLKNQNFDDELYILFAEFYENINNLSQAEMYYLKAVKFTDITNKRFNLYSIYKKLKDIYKKQNNFDKYLYYDKIVSDFENNRNEVMLMTSANMLQQTIQEHNRISKSLYQIQEFERIKKNYIIYQILFIVAIILLISYLYYKNIKKKKTIEKLQFEKNKYEDLVRRKSAYSSYLAHEFKTPLNIIKGFAQQLYEQDKANINLEKIIENVDRLNNFIDDFIEITNISEGNYKINLSHIKFNEFIKSIIQKYLTVAQSKKIEIIYTSDLEDDIFIEIDQKKFYLIINDLLDNAVKFSKEGYIYVIVTKTKIIDDTIDFTIKIKDNGPGIDDYVLENIKTFTIDLPNKGYDNFGIGLSLPIIFTYCKALNIAINFISEKNKGTEVELKLANVLFKQVIDAKLQHQQVEEVVNNITNSKNLLIYENITNYEYIENLIELVNIAQTYRNFTKIKEIVDYLEKIKDDEPEFTKVFDELSQAYKNFDYDTIFSILKIVQENLEKNLGEVNGKR